MMMLNKAIIEAVSSDDAQKADREFAKYISGLVSQHKDEGTLRRAHIAYDLLRGERLKVDEMVEKSQLNWPYHIGTWGKLLE